MSESLKDILLRRKDKQPAEVAIIKEFVMRRFNEPVGVTVQKNQIIITAGNAGLAGTLRLNIFELQNTVKSTKKLLIRVGQ